MDLMHLLDTFGYHHWAGVTSNTKTHVLA